MDIITRHDGGATVNEEICSILGRRNIIISDLLSTSFMMAMAVCHFRYTLRLLSDKFHREDCIFIKSLLDCAFKLRKVLDVACSEAISIMSICYCYCVSLRRKLLPHRQFTSTCSSHVTLLFRHSQLSERINNMLSWEKIGPNDVKLFPYWWGWEGTASFWYSVFVYAFVQWRINDTLLAVQNTYVKYSQEDVREGAEQQLTTWLQ